MQSKKISPFLNEIDDAAFGPFYFWNSSSRYAISNGHGDSIGTSTTTKIPEKKSFKQMLNAANTKATKRCYEKKAKCIGRHAHKLTVLDETVSCLSRQQINKQI